MNLITYSHRPLQVWSFRATSLFLLIKPLDLCMFETWISWLLNFEAFELCIAFVFFLFNPLLFITFKILQLQQLKNIWKDLNENMDKSQANTQVESPIDINMWESHRNRINARNSTFKSILPSMLYLSHCLPWVWPRWCCHHNWLRTLTLDTEAGTEAEEGWAHVIPSLASAIIQSAHYPMSPGLW